MTPTLPGRKSTLRHKGWSITVESRHTQPQIPKSPLNLQKPLPPRPVSYSSSVYSDDISSCRSMDDRHADLTSRQNPHRYGMDISTILPPAHPDCCCEGIDEEDSGESSSPATPVGSAERDVDFRLPIYSAYSGSGSLAYTSSPRSQRRSNDFRQSISDPTGPKKSPHADAYTIRNHNQEREKEISRRTQSTYAPHGLGIKGVPAGQPTITFAGTPPSTYSSRLAARRVPAPPPLKLYERALADSYVKTPYPRSARHMSVMSQKSVFDHGDDDDDDHNGWSPYSGGRRRKDSLYGKHFSGLGDLTQSIRRSSRRISIQQDVQEIVPPKNYENFSAPRPPRSPPVSAPPMIAAHTRPTTMVATTTPSAAAATAVASPSKTRPTTSPPSPGKMKSMLMKAKRSLSFGFADEHHHKKESRDSEALRKMVRDGTAEARLGQNFL
ncbi:hypothetical protein Micbo1qcDRAFT_200828 [Microdochium bolleyi]|uniref:Uncharacterized protein n=1 Tax=Microdochium bolleyi TaxID=196109 RepID=A0A136JE92_9PEZI|nr:hypothetical protein Micbo1qcDRAFT_200828 [Microdochium bolleyi]